MQGLCTNLSTPPSHFAPFAHATTFAPCARMIPAHSDQATQRHPNRNLHPQRQPRHRTVQMQTEIKHLRKINMPRRRAHRVSHLMQPLRQTLVFKEMKGKHRHRYIIEASVHIRVLPIRPQHPLQPKKLQRRNVPQTKARRQPDHPELETAAPQIKIKPKHRNKKIAHKQNTIQKPWNPQSPHRILIQHIQRQRP